MYSAYPFAPITGADVEPVKLISERAIVMAVLALVLLVVAVVSGIDGLFGFAAFAALAAATFSIVTAIRNVAAQPHN